jgi:PIN domain nuclease of toxin-antitoxin system
VSSSLLEQALDGVELRLDHLLPIGSADPADRFLGASAVVYDLALVTADAGLRNVAGVDVLPNS